MLMKLIYSSWTILSPFQVFKIFKNFCYKNSERSKLARSIRTSSTLEQGDSLSSDESSTTEQETKKKTVPKLKKELNP